MVLYGTPLVVAAVALAATYLPVRRAMRLEAREALELNAP